MRTESGAYQDHLAQTIQTNDPAVSERVIQAFRTIPRHPFVDQYYLHQAGTRVWTKHEREESDVWYQQVYNDCALVTRIDEHGRTLSSSSQPAVMASMLDALDVQPGMRVLEIGTGSGYNAALLAHLVGDPGLVTTIDIDADAIGRAIQRLPQVVGEGMTIVQADGRNGYQANAPYDRLLVTASAPAFPRAWLEQLAPGGVLVGVLQPHRAMLGGVLKAQKSGEELNGRILQTASFMELRSDEYNKRSIQIDFRAPAFASFPFEPLLFQPQALREDYDFTFFLSNDLPGLSFFQKDEALFCSQEAFPQGYVVFRQEPSLHIALHGDRTAACSLWNRLVRAYSLWDRLDRPAIPHYFFEMDGNRQALSLQTPSGMVWPFGIH